MMQTYADADGTSITVSQETLARQQGVTSRTIRNDQASLEDCGWIRMVHRGKGPGNPNEYRLAIPEIDFRISPEKSRNIRKLSTANVETEDGKCGSRFPTTMDNHGTMRTTPTNVVSNGTGTKLLRVSDLPAMTPLERAIIARYAELGMDV